MSHSKGKGTGIGPIVKSLLLTALKLLIVAISFACQLSSIILGKIAELLDKLSNKGHGNH